MMKKPILVLRLTAGMPVTTVLWDNFWILQLVRIADIIVTSALPRASVLLVLMDTTVILEFVQHAQSNVLNVDKKIPV